MTASDVMHNVGRRVCPLLVGTRVPAQSKLKDEQFRSCCGRNIPAAVCETQGGWRRTRNGVKIVFQSHKSFVLRQPGGGKKMRTLF